MKRLIVIERYSQKKRLLAVALLFISICFSSLNAQRDPLKEANKHFDNEDYHQALIYLGQIDKTERSGPLLYKRGICHYETNQLDQAQSDFKRAYDYGYKNSKTDYYLGLIRRDKGAFVQAAQFLKKYLLTLSEDGDERQQVRNLIRQCGSAIEISYQRPLAIVENPSRSVNSVYDDFGMIESPSVADNYYFTSDRPVSPSAYGKQKSKIFKVVKKDDVWQEASDMGSKINSRMTTVLSGFTLDASGLYAYNGTKNRGNVTQIGGPGNPELKQETSLPFTIGTENADVVYFDPITIVFSSEDLAGFGGYDLFVATKTDGKWNTPKNLGPKVNTAFDEVSPSVTNDGRVLYFSSNRPKSIGGYDVFRTKYLFEQGNWESPTNLGIPINTPGNERYFKLSYDGLTATFSSDRKTSFGGYDIFVARFTNVQEGQSFYVEQLPFADYIQSKGAIVAKEGVTAGMEPNSAAEVSVEKETIAPPMPEISYTFQPLYYPQGSQLFGKENTALIADLIVFLTANPTVSAELQAHTSNDGILEYNLFSSFRIARKVKEYITEQGINKDRIIIRGLGDSYPIVKSGKYDGDEVLADKMNPRIELQLHDSNNPNIEVIRKPKPVISSLNDTKYDLFSAIVSESVTYRIQVAVVNQMYRGVALDVYNDASIEEQEGTGLLAYTIGLYDSYAEALQTKRNLERDGLTDAKVIVYVDGIRMKEEELVYYVNDFPDLKNYMDYGN